MRRLSLMALALVFANVAHGQSDGRIPSRLTGDWQAPRIEDFAVFVRATQGGDAKTSGESPEKRKKSIASARDLLASGKVNGTTKAGLMSKLAELMAVQVDDVYQEEVNVYAESYAAFIDGDGQGQPPVATHDKSKSLALGAIEAHRNLIEQFPKFRKRPDILLRLAVLLGRVGSPNALPAFEGVMESFGGKRAGQLAAIGAGDLLLASGKTSEATASYKKALKGKDGLAKRYARYRLAWVPAAGKSFAAGEAKKALGVLKSLAVKGCKEEKKGAPEVLCRDLGFDLVYLFA